MRAAWRSAFFAITACAPLDIACAATSAAPPAADAGPNADAATDDGAARREPDPGAAVAVSDGEADAGAPVATAIGAGQAHTCALAKGGRVFCWGDNTYGQLGTGNVDPSPVPALARVHAIVAIAVGGSHTCALTAGSEVTCWGWNFLGQLGNPSAGTYSAVPVTVVGLDAGVTAIAAGDAHTCAIVAGGGVQCWGADTGGQLGSDEASEGGVAPSAVPNLGARAIRITGGGVHSCALLADGRVSCWGTGNYGQLGIGVDTGRSAPAPIASSERYAALAAGTFFTCAVANAGAECWGYNRLGSVGDGTTSNRFAPARVLGLTTGVTAVAAGDGHACALLADGSVACWGAGTLGQLGTGARADSLTAVAARGVTSATSIAAGRNHSCAIVGGGHVICWGEGEQGQLGSGARASSALAAPVCGL
jgi:alpha-tubulin suppressor-like RCC1 family protein